jgi:hypothetical protein
MVGMVEPIRQSGCDGARAGLRLRRHDCHRRLTISRQLGVGARPTLETVLSLKSMTRARRLPARVSVVAAGCAVALAVGIPLAFGAPTADDQGYIDSTARCSSPDVVVAFGSTASSRVAICKTPSGQYQYRGVRVRDGAKLILPASQGGIGVFTAENDGITYTVTSSSLAVSSGSETIRDEPMVDFHGPASSSTSGSSASTPTTTSTTTPSPGSTTAAPTTAATTTTWQPPLAAEVGGSGRR